MHDCYIVVHMNIVERVVAAIAVMLINQYIKKDACTDSDVDVCLLAVDGHDVSWIYNR